MKKIFFIAAAVAALLTSCQKEKVSDDSSAKGVKTITASIGNSTKVVMGEDNGTKTKLNWQEGDNLLLINIHFVGEDAEYSSSKYSANNSGETTTFNYVEGVAISTDDMHYAFYPYEKMQFNTLQSGNPEFRFNYSDSQTYTENSFDKNVMPLFALNTGGTNFTLDAMAPVLRLNVKLASEDSDVKVNSLVIESTENKLSGISILDDGGFYEPEENTGKSITLDCGEGVAINNTDAIQFCIVLPPNTYDEGDLKITIKTNKGNIVKTSKAEATFAAGKVYNINVSGDPTPALPAGALPGVFTVSDDDGVTTKQIYFSQGNLWADGDKALHFEANQYSSASSWDASHVSHFTWSSTVEDAVGGSNSGDNLFCDESHKVSVDGGEAIYYALSTDEWQYLFNNHSKKWATVNGVGGYVIAPDNVTLQDEKTSYTATELNDANLVFLPAAGLRSGSNVIRVGVRGRYWSSTAYNSDLAYCVSFDSNGVSLGDGNGRDYGYSVRLITDAN